MTECRVDLIYGNFKLGFEDFGISRYHLEIHKRLEDKVSINWISYKPTKFGTIGRLLNMYIKYPITIVGKTRENAIIHILSPWFSHILLYPKIVDRKKTIVTFFDVEPSIMFSYSRVLLHWYLCRKGIMKSKRIITISNFAKSEIIRFLGYNYPEENIVVVHEGVDRNIFHKIEGRDIIAEKLKKEKLNFPEKTKIVLFVGSEQPRKNFKRVLQAFYKVKKNSNFPVKLLKIGKAESKSYRRESIETARKLGILEDVLFLDYVSDKELVMYYNIADCLVLPTFYEGGFALPVLEAMSCECPVITSNIPPLLELTDGKGAIFVDPFNVDELTKAILELLSERVDIESLIREGIQIAEKYSWEKSAFRLYKVYKELQRE